MSCPHSGRRSHLLSVALPFLLVVAAAPIASLPQGDATPRRAAAGVRTSLTAAPFGSARTSGPLAAWDRAATEASGVLVAVIDTGVSPTADLAGRIEPGESFVGGDAEADENGHGTAVAGIVAGSAGVCRGCRILPLRVSAGAGGTAGSDDIATAIDAAVRRGAAVINLSMVSSTPSDPEQAAVERAVAAGAVVVAAAGNAASSTPSYPASYPGVLSVGATGDDGSLASFSNRGPWVSVLAPGCGRSHSPDGGEILFCGTSAAAPYVAGVAAVLRAAVPTTTAADVVAAIRGSAHPADGAASGIVDPPAALAVIGGVSPTPAVKPLAVAGTSVKATSPKTKKWPGRAVRANKARALVSTARHTRVRRGQATSGSIAAATNRSAR